MLLPLSVFLHLQLFEQLLEMLHGHILQHNGFSACLLTSLRSRKNERIIPDMDTS